MYSARRGILPVPSSGGSQHDLAPLGWGWVAVFLDPNSLVYMRDLPLQLERILGYLLQLVPRVWFTASNRSSLRGFPMVFLHLGTPSHMRSGEILPPRTHPNHVRLLETAVVGQSQCSQYFTRSVLRGDDIRTGCPVRRRIGQVMAPLLIS